MHWLDFLIVALYFGSILYLGYRYRRQETSGEFYLAGRRLSGALTGISVTITLFSAVSYMGSAAFVFGKDLTLVASILANPLTIPVVNRLILPFYHRLPITTAYEYLERRFNRSLRSTASILFILLRLFYLGVVIYAPAVALAVVTGWPIHGTIVLMGTVSVVLACLGGMRAVVWAEVIKFVALFVSMIAIVAMLGAKIEGGLGTAFEICRAGGRLHAFNWAWDPTVTFSVWAVMIGSFFQNLSSYGADQITIQRYLTSRSLAESRRAYTLSTWLGIPTNVLIALMGLGMYVYYQQHPAELGDLASADYIVPFFAVHALPPGMAGLVIASIFSMSLTTHSSGLHSVNTAVMNDFLQGFLRRDAPPAYYVRAARIGTLVWGGLTTGLAFYISRLGIMQITAKKINLFFGGVLLGIFLLGMTSRRTGSSGALLGALTGMGVVAGVSYGTAVSFFWYGPLGCLVTMGSGYLFGLLFPLPAEERVRGFCLSGRPLEPAVGLQGSTQNE
jgi:SSS family transporter